MSASCATVLDLIPEFALGTLGGDERALVLDHLRSCATCRGEADHLATVVDEIVATAGDREPPPGFEQRVLGRLTEPVTRTAVPSHRPWRQVAVAAAVMAMLVAGIAVALAVSRDAGPERSALAARSAPLRTPGGRTVGRASITAAPAALLVDAPSWDDGRAGTYRLRVTATDGRVTQQGPIDLEDGRAAYALDGVDAAHVVAVEMVERDGRVACRAQFT